MFYVEIKIYEIHVRAQNTKKLFLLIKLHSMHIG